MTSINARVDVVKFFSDRNPKVDQNIFEDISALIRSRDEAPIMTLMCVDSFVMHGAPGTLSTFEQAFFGPFTVIDRQCALLFRVRVPHTHDPSQNTFHTRFKCSHKCCRCTPPPSRPNTARYCPFCSSPPAGNKRGAFLVS